MIAALITKENKPIVKHVIGNEKNFKTGFTNVLSTASTTASFIASTVLATETPIFSIGKMYANAIKTYAND